MICQSILSNEMLAKGLSGSEFKIVARLAVYGNKSFDITEEKIAQMTGLSVSTIQRTIPLLVGKGLMYRAIRHKDGRRMKSRYRMQLPKPNRKHFFCLPIELIRVLPPNCLLVYAYLICKAGRNRQAYPSERQIAEALGISRTTVRNCTANLECNGLISKERRVFEKKRKTKAYRSFAYSIGGNIERIDRSDCRVCAKMRIGRGIPFSYKIACQNANLRLVVGLTDFSISKLIFRPPRPPNLNLE